MKQVTTNNNNTILKSFGIGDETEDDQLQKGTPHQKHKYLKIENGKYIYDYDNMGASDHEKAASHHLREFKRLTGHRFMSIDQKDFTAEMKLHNEEGVKHQDLAEKKKGDHREPNRKIMGRVQDAMAKYKITSDQAQSVEDGLLISFKNDFKISKNRVRELMRNRIPKEFVDKIISEAFNEKEGKSEGDLERRSGKNSSFSLYGKKFETKVFATDEETNKFLENNKHYGMIGEDKEGIHVALNSDKGTPDNSNKLKSK